MDGHSAAGSATIGMKPLLVTVIVTMGLLGCAPDERFGVDAHCLEVNPVSGRVHNATMLDVNNDGDGEEVVIYTFDGDVFLDVFENPDTRLCDAIVEMELDTLNLIHRRMTLTITDMELIDVTGDEVPELHLGFEKRGGGRYSSGAVHHLYDTKTWERIFVSDTCLRSNAFEIRDVDSSPMKEIYYENDSICDEVKGTLDYARLQWDGTQFQVLERGERNPALWEDPLTIALLMCNLFCFVIFPFLLFVLISMLRNRERPVVS